MMNQLRFIFIVGFVLIFQMLFATSYFVSPTGNNNNPGTLIMPFKTIQHALDQLQAGDVLNIRSGTYNEKLEFFTSGNNSQMIQIQNYLSETPIIDGAGITNKDVLLYMENVSFITIKGIHFKNNTINGGGGIMAQGACHDLTITNNKISNISFSTDLNAPVSYSTNASPLLIYADTAPDSAYNILITNNEVYNNVTGFSENISLAGNVSNFEISNNLVHDNTNIGIDVSGNYEVSPIAQFDHARYGVVKQNTIYNCISPYSPAAGIYVDGGHHIVVENNVSHHNGYGGEIGCEESGTTDDVVFRNNVFYNNTTTGMHVGGYDFVNTGGKVVNSKVLNNTFYKNDTENHYNGEIHFTQFENGTVENNIFYMTDQNVFSYAVLDQPNLTMNYNIIYGPNGENQFEGDWGNSSYSTYSEFKNVSNTNTASTFADPVFENTASNDFHLKDTSPAINAGNPNFTADPSELDMDLQSRLNDGVVDCGADEALTIVDPSASEEMTLKGTWDNQNSSTSGVKYNDLWGYVDCEGNEYAILGSPAHVHFLDVTNPAQINEVKRFTPGATTIWRDFKTYKTFAYGVADQGNEGLLVFDLTNISNGNVSMVNQVTADFQRCHNVYIDEEFGKLYIVGSNTVIDGVIVYDISQDPANPVKIASPSLSQGGYIHDAFVKNNILYGSHGYNGFHIWNFANPSTPFHIASVQTNGYNHSNWVSEDGQYAFVAEEVPSGLPMLTIDISNMMMDDIEIVKEFKDPNLAPAHTNNTPHNPYVRGNYLITSYYEDGVQIHDISDPLNPELVAHYDTEPGNSSYNGTTGNWGVYPYFPSGNIIASDTKHGLFILKADNISLSPIQAPSAPITEIGAEGGNTMCLNGEKELIATQGAESYVWYKDGEEINATLNNTITISEAGDYYVIGYSGYCSSQSSTIEITESEAIDLSITASLGEQFCANEINVLTATAGYQYVWSTNATSQSIDVQQSGVYTVTVTDENGCTKVEEYEVSSIAVPVATIDATNASICEGETTTIIANGGDSYLWSNGSTSSSIEVNEPGSYSVTVTLENGCSDINEIIITEAGNINAVIESTNGQQICEGTSTELIASQAIEYLWENGATTQSITVDQAGLYIVTVTNEAGCTATAQIQVGILQGPNGQISGSSSLCNNSDIELTASGVGTYQWNTTETTDKITVSEAGTYTVTITNDNGCTQVLEHNVTNLPNLTPTISPTSDIICLGESFTLVANGGTIFEWNTGATTQEITQDTPGDYSVTVTDENGCTGSTNISIEGVDFDFEITGDLSLCTSTIGQLSASAGVQWNWSNGQTGQTINITQAGAYSVTATNSDGCTTIKSVIVEESENIDVQLSSSNGLILCQGESTTITANPPAMSYSWSTGATTQTIDNTDIGEYTVTVTNQIGCTGISTIVIEGSNFAVDIEGDLSLCASTTLTATGGETWLWSTGETTQSILVSETGDYTVEAIDNKGCHSSKTVTVVEGDTFFPEITNNEESCNEAILTVVQEYENYSWNTGATTQQIMVFTSGVYTVTVTNSSGCTGINEIEVNIEGINAQIEGASKFCRNTSSTLTASGGDSFLWNTEETSSTIEISNPGIYIVTVTDENGCSGVADFVVEYFPNTEVVIATNDVLLCEGNTVNLSTSGESFVWNTGAETSNIDVTETGVYSVVVTDKNGCSSENEIEITFNPLPEGTIVSSNGFEICHGSSTTLSIESDQEVEVTWYLSNENLGNSSELETDNAGVYSAAITMNGCTNETETVELSLLEPIVPVISEVGNTLSSTTATSYKWYFNNIEIADQTEQTMVPIISGDYYVITVDENGCKSQSNTIAVIISSLNDIEWISNTKLFPNPTDNDINLFIESTLKQNVNIQIKNILGQIFLQDEIVILANGNNFKFNTSTYPSGMYFFEIESDGQVEVMKFVVER